MAGLGGGGVRNWPHSFKYMFERENLFGLVCRSDVSSNKKLYVCVCLGVFERVKDTMKRGIRLCGRYLGRYKCVERHTFCM